jgi:serine/threonine protein kinase
VASVVPFGKYLLLGRIAQGGMAEVFLAKTFGSSGFERLVAVKRLLPNVLHNEEFVHMFIDEAKIAAQLAHASIVQIYELNEWDKQLYIAMEFIHGKELRALAVRAKKLGRFLSQRIAAHVIAKAAEGLDYAHHKKDPDGKSIGLVHRDISPQNILVSYEGEAKIIDFGIAKAKDRISQTQVGVLKGKIGYMSPEQVSGEALDSRSDLFSLGCVLYELLTQQRAFRAETEFATFERVQNAEYVPPAQLGVTLDPALEKILRKMLTKDRSARYPRGAEVAGDLQRWLLATGDPLSNEDVATEIRSLFQKEYDAEMAKLATYRQTKPPKEMQELLEDKQQRAAAEQMLEDNTLRISLSPEEAEAEEQSTQPERVSTDLVIAEPEEDDTLKETLVASGPAKVKMSESQSIEQELRLAFTSPSAKAVLAHARRETATERVERPSRLPPPGPMLQTIDDAEHDPEGFTRGEIMLIVGASVFALIFVLGVYFYTTR